MLDTGVVFKADQTCSDLRVTLYCLNECLCGHDDSKSREGDKRENYSHFLTSLLVEEQDLAEQAVAGSGHLTLLCRSERENDLFYSLFRDFI